MNNSHTIICSAGTARYWTTGLLAAGLAVASASAVAGLGPQPDARAHEESRHGHGAVLPASARPLGHSLHDMARLTANFNASDRSGAVVPVPTTPFQILYTSADNPGNNFSVMQGRFMYVPVAYNDNSLPIIGDFPASAENRRQLLKYWYSQRQMGTVATEITVDGRTICLGGDYLAGVDFAAPLSDGATKYMAPAAFIRPLPPGAHTVEIHFKATGDALREPPFPDYFPLGYFEFRVTYNVTVY